jgi:crotonobetainyl-CoA:carnitine CoA-transferase CaiB-like acyl-CoA transferase
MSAIHASNALRRFRVLDLSRVRAGPTCVRMLADFGADVIRIEPPAGVDPNEAMFAGNRNGGDFQNLNRNKRSMTLNLKTPAGLEVFKRLARNADVIVENWRPDVKTRLGLDYESLRNINPRLILASISGYGQEGPYAWRPGFDQVIQGMSGLMSVTGLPGQGPVRAGLAVADSSSGLYAAIGILVALLERERSGEGQWVQSSLLHSLVAMLDFQVARYLTEGDIPVQAGNDHPTSSPMGLFDAADGAFNLGASGEGNWVRLCKAIGRPEWIGAEAWIDEKARRRNRAQLSQALNEVFRDRPVAYWVTLLNEAGVPAGPLYTIPEMCEDPQVVQQKMTEKRMTPEGITVGLVTQPVRLNRTPASVATTAPAWGQHTEEVMAEAGYGPEEIEELKRQGVL